ncbi:MULTISPECIES: DUF4328 domain-containing protein [unclassified Streptomyces]|uniref:DUF4328 domain-containing protein n=1 Tax=unclassified Streptomyces TaxID=2593676 RepID=UPI00365F09BB
MSFSTPDPAPSASPQPGFGPPPVGPYPAPAPLPPAAGVLQSPQGLATALTALLSVGAAVDVFSAGVNMYTWTLMKDLIGDPLSVDDDSLDLADTLTGLAGLAQFTLRLATVVVFLVWFHRVRCNGQVFRPDGFTQSTGWAIGGWFVPFANLYFPYRTARETWEASTRSAPDGTYRNTSNAPVTAWWIVFLASLLIDRVFAAQYLKAETPEELRAVSAVGAVSDLTTVVAAVLALLFVRKLTAMQHAKATRGPVAHV